MTTRDEFSTNTPPCLSGPNIPTPLNSEPAIQSSIAPADRCVPTGLQQSCWDKLWTTLLRPIEPSTAPDCPSQQPGGTDEDDRDDGGDDAA